MKITVTIQSMPGGGDPYFLVTGSIHEGGYHSELSNRKDSLIDAIYAARELLATSPISLAEHQVLKNYQASPTHE